MPVVLSMTIHFPKPVFSNSRQYSCIRVAVSSTERYGRKSFFAGAGASIATVIVSSAAATTIMLRYPQLAVRIFPAQGFDLQWGAYYYLNFPLWQIVAAGVVAFIIGFGWMLRRSLATS